MNTELRQEQERVDSVIGEMNNYCNMIRHGIER